MNITAPALRRLQVLYGQYEAHSLDAPGKSREDRLSFASVWTGRTIHSFSNLTVEEGISLIDGIQRMLNVKAPSKTPRRRIERKAAEKAGTEGRHDQIHNEVTLASSDDFARIQNQLTRLGWNQAGLDRFLLSSRSPLKGRGQIRTLGDANKVYWALKHIPVRDVFTRSVQNGTKYP
jgi:hypothetical protein